MTLKRLSSEYSEITSMDNLSSKGFGFAVRNGLENFTGDVVAVVMGDGSDDPEDVVRFFKKISEGYDCVFGSRFLKGGAVGYPLHKLILNRLINQWIRLIFAIKYNDVTNAFKMYHQELAVSSTGRRTSGGFNIIHNPGLHRRYWRCLQPD